MLRTTIVISHGCFLRLREFSVHRSILGDWSRLYYGVELQDTLMLGTDYYQTESGIASLLAEGNVPICIGRDTKIRNASLTRMLRLMLLDTQAMKTILIEIPSLARLVAISSLRIYMRPCNNIIRHLKISLLYI
ncbi:hypothetical protein HID58_012805 [Brassica napus]|uniref:Uncharacterized protein n=1 Tax=Brassica napus TaxID=3708 RepID=A0ABQ8E2J9_BRANA|nr:hypothetical protein HID58_012805 [Brassica napus]